VRALRDDMSEQELRWLATHAAICIFAGAALAVQCYRMYQTGMTPAQRVRDLAGAIAWVVVAATGVGIALICCAPLWPKTTPQANGLPGKRRGSLVALVLVEVLIAVVGLTLRPANGGHLPFFVRVLGCSLVVNFFVLLLGA